MKNLCLHNYSYIFEVPVKNNAKRRKIPLLQYVFIGRNVTWQRTKIDFNRKTRPARNKSLKEISNNKSKKTYNKIDLPANKNCTPKGVQFLSFL
jgi:hypothetical protein